MLGAVDGLLGGPGHVCLSPSVITGQSGQQTVRSSIQEGDSDSPGLAQHAVVLGSSRSVIPATPLSPQSSRSGDSTFQQGMSQGSDQSQSSHLAPRAEAIKKQGFSCPVALRIEAPQRRSTRSIYESKWAVLLDGVKQVRWTSGHHLSNK